MTPAQFKWLIAGRWPYDRFRRRHDVVGDPAYVRYWDFAASEGTGTNDSSWTAGVGSFIIDRVLQLVTSPKTAMVLGGLKR